MALYLESEERRKANRVRKFIVNYVRSVENTFLKCKVCDGTGLSGVTKYNHTCSWDGLFCPVCEGTGYIDWKHNNVLAICDKCGGTGGSYMLCDRCDGKGVLDWVSALRRGIRSGIGVEEDGNG